MPIWQFSRVYGAFYCHPAQLVWILWLATDLRSSLLCIFPGVRYAEFKLCLKQKTQHWNSKTCKTSPQRLPSSKSQKWPKNKDVETKSTIWNLVFVIIIIISSLPAHQRLPPPLLRPPLVCVQGKPVHGGWHCPHTSHSAEPPWKQAELREDALRGQQLSIQRNHPEHIIQQTA